MQHTVFTAMAFALLLAIAALVRETKLRRALQELLRRLFQHWRNRETPPTDNTARDSRHRGL